MAVGIGVTVKLEGEDNTGAAFKSAADNATKYQQQVVQIKQGWQGTVTAVSTAVMAIKAIAEPLFNALSAPIKMAMEADKSYSRLLKTLKATGQIVGESEASIEKYINTVELLTLTDEKMVAGVLATNLAFGMNIKQAKLAVEASAALAKINGTDMASANQLLLQSMNMQLRGIAKVVPELNKLTEAELRRGKGISVVIEKLGYLNEMTATTPYLALGRANVMWEDFQRTIGRAMLAGVDWNKVYDKMKAIMDALGKVVEDNKETIAKFGVKIVESGVSALEKMASAIILLVPHLSDLYDMMSKVTAVVALAVVPWVQLTLAVIGLYAAMTGNDDLYGSMMKLMQGFDKMLRNSMRDLAGVRNEMDKTRASTEKLTVSVDKLTPRKPKVTQAPAPTPKSTGPLSGFKDQMSKQREEQRQATEQMKKDAVEAKNFIQKTWDSLKVGIFGRGEEEKKKTAEPSQKKDWAAGAEFNTKKTGEAFSDKALTTNKAEVELKRVANDEITALAKDGQAKRQTDLETSLAKISKLEQDNAKMGLGRQEDLLRARQKVQDIYNQGLIESERAITELLGDEANARAFDQFRRMQELVKWQEERGSRSSETAKENASEMEALENKFMEEEINARRDMLDEIDDMTGMSYAKAERDYQRHLDRLKKMYDTGKLGPVGSTEAKKTYEKSVGEVDQQRDKEKGLTSQKIYDKIAGAPVDANTVQRLDNSMKEANKVVDAIQGGATSIITAVGSLWGPVGALIAAIVNFLRMSPEQFLQFINELMDSALVLISNILTNVGTLVEKVLIAVPEIMSAILGELFSVGTWMKMGEAILRGIKYMLQGIGYWFNRLLFGSQGEKSPYEKQLEEESKKKAAAQAAAGEVKFGSDLADQGENKFKIKDVTAKKAGSAGSLALIQEELPKITEAAGKSFGEQMWDSFKEAVGKAWDWIKKIGQKIWDGFVYAVTVVWEWLLEIGKKIWDGLVVAVTTVWEWLATIGQKIWDGLVAAATIVWEWIATIGSKIWDGLVAAATVVWEWLSTIGAKIWDGLVNACKTLSWEWLATVGAKIWDGLVAAATAVWTWLSEIGAAIWDGLVNACKTLSWEWLATLGAKIWDGLTVAATAVWEWIKSIGGKIWDGLVNAAKTLSWEWLATIGGKIWSGFWNGLISAWEWFGNAGTKIWSGFWDGFVTAWNWFGNAGTKIWSGLKEGITGAWEWIKSIGSKIWEGLSGGLSKLTGGGGGGGGGTLGQITKALGFSRGGDVTGNMKGSSLVPIFSAMGALRAQDGIQSVPGSGISDTVPILARAGERVLTPQQARSMDSNGGITLNISINVASGAKGPDKTDIKEMGEKIIEYIKRESKNGRNILRPSGVY
jgi:hypothetical protein